jgi:lipopolysaccharide transport system ATP-binding protein
MSLGTPKQILNEYTRQLYTSNHIINSNDLRQISADTKNENENNESTWIDYRSELINSSQQANLLKITQFKDELLTRESFGNGKASIIDAKLIEASANQPLMCARGGERVILQIDAKANQYIENPIVGFLLKNAKGMTLLGDNTLNSLQSLLGERPLCIDANDNYRTEFEFTLPMLQKGYYSLTISLAEGTQEDHDQLQWMNDALILESINTSIAAGLAGVPMHRIDFSIEKDSGTHT